MVSPSTVTATESDGYIPMSPRTFSFVNTDNDSQSASLSPPPIHRHLKPSLRRGEYQHHLGSWMLPKFLMVTSWPNANSQSDMSFLLLIVWYLYILYSYSCPCDAAWDTASLIICCPVLISSPAPTTWLERPLDNHRMSHSSNFEQSPDWVMVRSFCRNVSFLYVYKHNKMSLYSGNHILWSRDLKSSAVQITFIST